MKIELRQGNEAGPASRRVRQTTDLSKHPAFGRSVGLFSRGGNPVSRFTYESTAGEIVLRFNVLWTAKSLSLGIETQFPHQPPLEIKNLLDLWLLSSQIEVSF